MRDFLARHRVALRASWAILAAVCVITTMLVRTGGALSVTQMTGLFAPFCAFVVVHLMVMYEAWWSTTSKSMFVRLRQMFLLLVLAASVFVVAKILQFIAG